MGTIRSYCIKTSRIYCDVFNIIVNLFHLVIMFIFNQRPHIHEILVCNYVINLMIKPKEINEVYLYIRWYTICVLLLLTYHSYIIHTYLL